jgi:phage FluMu protein Com
MTFNNIVEIFFFGIVFIVLMSFSIIVRCPKCKSIWTTEEQKTQLRDLITGHKEFKVQRRCKKCNNIWNEYVTRKR